MVHSVWSAYCTRADQLGDRLAHGLNRCRNADHVSLIIPLIYKQNAVKVSLAHVQPRLSDDWTPATARLAHVYNELFHLEITAARVIEDVVNSQ